MLARYLKLVHKTNRWQFDPEDFYQRVDEDWPAILAMWHGQHFMIPVFKRPKDKIRALISRHRDGELNAQAVEYFGAKCVRGSGALNKTDIVRKGGSSALIKLVRELDDGATIVQTADIPKVSRVAGEGIVLLARESGRPIFPIAIASSRRIDLNSWDKSSISLPLGRGAFVAGNPIMVPKNTTRNNLESYRLQVEDGLNTATRRAYEIVDGSVEKKI